MVRCWSVSHFDGTKHPLYEGAYTDDIDDRCQQYADRSGYQVRLVCDEPHQIQKFHPKVLRSDPSLPPPIDAPAETHLEKLAWHALRADGGMFLDDRMLQTRKNRRMNRNKLVAYLNHSEKSGFYVKIRLPEKFGLKKPIPRSIRCLEGAVEWTLRQSFWKNNRGES